MAERHTLRLNARNRDKAHIGVSKAPDGWMLELREPTRSDEQNDALHGLIDQILKQRPTLNGMAMDKVRYKAVFMQALGHEMLMLPTLAGDGFFPMGLSTSSLTKSEFTNLIEFVLAWAAEQKLTITHFDGAEDGAVAKNAAPRAA